MRALAGALVVFAIWASGGADRGARAEPLGTPPTFTARKPGTIPEGPLPNAAAITRQIWVPGLDEGYVPQGLSVADGALYLSAYLSTDVAQSRGPCRVFRIDPVRGAVTAMLDLPAACGHAGGLAKGSAGRLWIADTRMLYEIALAPAGASELGRVLREVEIEAPLKGSFAAGDGVSLWLGSYERDQPGRLDAVPLASITGPRIGARDAKRTLILPNRAQGAAFDRQGWLWITRSGATLGELLRLDPTHGTVLARTRLPDGVEDLSFDADGGLWTVSEAGSRRWSGWATHFPFLFRLDPAKLL